MINLPRPKVVRIKSALRLDSIIIMCFNKLVPKKLDNYYQHTLYYNVRVLCCLNGSNSRDADSSNAGVSPTVGSLKRHKLQKSCKCLARPISPAIGVWSCSAGDGHAAGAYPF